MMIHFIRSIQASMETSSTNSVSTANETTAYKIFFLIVLGSCCTPPRLTHVPLTADVWATNSLTKPGGRELATSGSSPDQRTNNRRDNSIVLIDVKACCQYGFCEQKSVQ